MTPHLVDTRTGFPVLEPPGMLSVLKAGLDMLTPWTRIAQEEPFVGRCGSVGDELGSQIIATRLVHDLMKLCFLMERQYAPYSKWFGTAFARLQCAKQLGPILQAVLRATTWQEREMYLTSGYEFVAKLHNGLGITSPLATVVSFFHNRPYQVIRAERFVEAIRAVIQDEEVRKLPAGLGAIDQFVDSTDVLSQPEVYTKLKMLFTLPHGE